MTARAPSGTKSGQMVWELLRGCGNHSFCILNRQVCTRTNLHHRCVPKSWQRVPLLHPQTPRHLTPGSARKPAHNRARPARAAEQQRRADTLPCPLEDTHTRGPRQAPGGPHPRHSEWHLNPSRSWLRPAVLAQALCPELGLTRASHSAAFGSFKIQKTFLTHLWRQT